MSKTLTKHAIADYERLYGLKLSDHEVGLLTKEQPEGLDKQRQHLLNYSLAPITCPACNMIISARSAALDPQPNSGFATTDDKYQCPHCKVKLFYNISITDGSQWFKIQAGQTVTIR